MGPEIAETQKCNFNIIDQQQRQRIYGIATAKNRGLRFGFAGRPTCRWTVRGALWQGPFREKNIFLRALF